MAPSTDVRKEAGKDVTDTSPYTSAPRISRAVEYNQRDLLLYALGIGSRDLRYTYEHHEDFAAFPTYPLVLLKKGDSFDTLPFPSPCMNDFPEPPLRGVTVGLDAEKVIEKVAELPKEGAKLKLVGGIVGIHKKRSGALVERLFELQDDAGKVYYRMVDGSYLVGPKDFTGSGTTHTKHVDMPSGPPMCKLETPTDTHANQIFRLSGDYNPLHIDPGFAKSSGFDRPIMHGQCLLGIVTRALLDALANGDQKRFRSVQMRLSSPVLPGQTLVTCAWPLAPETYAFQTTILETGKICGSNGMLMLHPQGRL